MEAKHIKFGKEICGTFQLDSSFKVNLEDHIVKFEYIGDDFYLIYNDECVRLQINNNANRDTIQQFIKYRDQGILRADRISGDQIFLTFFVFYKIITFAVDEKFTVILGAPVDLYLKRKNIHDKLGFFNSQFLLGDRLFAIADQKESGKFILIGDSYKCEVVRDRRNYLYATKLSENRAQNIYGSILVYQGNVGFADALSVEAQLKSLTNQKYEESIKDTSSLLKLWKLYNDLELETNKQEVEELGYLHYTSVFRKASSDGSEKYTFNIDKRVDLNFSAWTNGLSVYGDENFNKNNITKSEKGILIGDKIELSIDRRMIAIYCTANLIDLPKSGYLMGSFQGSAVIAKRREFALSKINNCKTPLINLKLLLQTGESEIIPSTKYQPINDALAKRIFGNSEYNFTERQREAINVAINTPDIALIQGPPGTGKTTVIRAIIARLSDIYAGNIRILVSSAQHDAVDNAIENVTYGGLPVNRLGGKFGSEEKTNVSIYKWVNEVKMKCDAFIQSEENANDRGIFRRINLILDQCKLNIFDADLIKSNLTECYSLLLMINADPEIIEQNHRIIRSLNTDSCNDSINKSELIEFKKLLDGQRTDPVSFLDDGRNQLKKLIGFSKINYDFEIPKIWTNLRKHFGEDDAAPELASMLKEFEISLMNIKEKFYSIDEEINAEEFLKKDIFDLTKSINFFILEKGKASSGMLSSIIWDFVDQLENPINIKNLIDIYANISAVTCQQAASKKLEVSSGGSYEYDYVIIDESARANPLDLLIPMSQGRKIILVGDHKQLPHLLERNIVEKVKRIEIDPEIEQLLEESLFARLYKLFDKYNKNKRTAMLQEQYRMHPKIAELVNHFYNGELISKVSNDDRIHGMNLYDNKPIAWIKVLNDQGEESTNYSKFRRIEVERVMMELHKILKANQEYTVGIITFYKMQSVLINQEVLNLSYQDQKRISVGTVDAFQGKEFDVVILSTVRSNKYEDLRKRIGFLDSDSRLCVAFSRGKRLLICIGDNETVACNADKIFNQPLSNLYKMCDEEGYCE